MHNTHMDMDMHNMHMNEMPMNDSMAMGMDMHMMHMQMPMFFHFSKSITHLLFEPWTVGTVGELVGAVAFSFALAIVYEGLKTVKDNLTQWTNKKFKTSHTCTCDNKDVSLKNSLINAESRTPVRHRLLKLWLMRAILSVLRTVEIGLAYLLMLLAMTYNGWIFLSVCFGAGAGYFVFIHFQSSKRSDDHCG